MRVKEIFDGLRLDRPARHIERASARSERWLVERPDRAALREKFDPCDDLDRFRGADLRSAEEFLRHKMPTR